MKRLKYNYQLGDKFNKLIVVGQTRNNYNQLQILCNCDCGTEVRVMPYNLFNGKTKSCGCHKRQLASERRKYSVGDKIGSLTLIEELVSTEGNRKFKMRCDCGIIKESSIHYGVKSCGCLKRTCKNPILSYYNHYKSGCNRKNKRIFELTTEEFKTFIKGDCFYCGQSPSMKIRYTETLRNGIDRKDNTIGYINNNCVSCCAECNFAKRELSIEQFLSLVERIYKHKINS